MTASVTKLEEKRVHSLAVVDRGYLVFRRRPLTEMPEEQQAKIREVYNETGYVNEPSYSLEIFGFYTDFDMAVKLAAEKKGSWLEIPVNHSLPDELGRYHSQGNPGSDSDEWYKQTNPDMELIHKQDVVAACEIMSRCLELASNP